MTVASVEPDSVEAFVQLRDGQDKMAFGKVLFMMTYDGVTRYTLIT